MNKEKSEYSVQPFPKIFYGEEVRLNEHECDAINRHCQAMQDRIDELEAVTSQQNDEKLKDLEFRLKQERDLNNRLAKKLGIERNIGIPEEALSAPSSIEAPKDDGFAELLKENFKLKDYIAPFLNLKPFHGTGNKQQILWAHNQEEANSIQLGGSIYKIFDQKFKQAPKDEVSV